MFIRSNSKAVFVILLVLIFTPSLLWAGWIQKDRDGTQTFISDGKLKIIEPDSEGSYLVINYPANQILLVDGNRKAYAAGAIEAYCEMMKKMLAAFGEMESAFGGETENAPDSVTVVAAGKDNIAGMAADKYKVLVDGELYEEIWLARDAGIMDELGKRHEQFMDCLSEADDPVENTKAYKDLSTKGWELRNISYEFGEKEYNTNVMEIKKASIPDSEFVAPGGYKKMKFEEFFNSGVE